MTTPPALAETALAFRGHASTPALDVTEHGSGRGLDEVAALARIIFEVAAAAVALPAGPPPPGPLIEEVARQSQEQRKAAVVADAAADPRWDGSAMRFAAAVPLLRRDGSVAGALCIADGRPRHPLADDLTVLETLAGLALDRIQLGEARSRCREMRDEKAEILAIIGHEIRRPLAGALGLAETLAADSTSEAERVDLAAGISYSLGDASGAVEDLLARGGGRRVRPVDVIEDVTAVTRTLEPELAARVSLVVKSRGMAIADPIRVRQIVRNLVANASHHGGDRIEIAVGRSPDGDVSIEVADDGAGIAAGIGDVFAGVDGGLPVSRRLAREMAGDLLLLERPGWTVFRLTLPDARKL